MKIEKSDAVAICQDYGYATADGWDKQKLVKKLGEAIKLYRSGEFDWAKDELLPIIEGLAEADSFELIEKTEKEEEDDLFKDVEDSEDGEKESGEDDDWDEEQDINNIDEGDPKDCPLQGGERVIVHAKDGDWKGIVKEPITARRVLVRNKGKEEWEELAENCEVVKRKPKKNESEDERKIRELKDEIEGMEGDKTVVQKKKAKGRKSTREETVVRLLRKSGSFLIDDLVESVEKSYVRQGGGKKLTASDAAVKRVVKYGTMFGVVKQTGNEVVWLEQEK
jgi:hypothetical protein